jgi:small-conductance mechanosensitive channel
MYRPILLLLASLLAAVCADPAAANDWSGTWDTHLRGGSVRLILKQDGDRVTGHYPLYSGRIEAKAEGRRLTGRWFEGDQSGGFLLVLSRDRSTFAGRYDDGDWWSGERTRRPGLTMVGDLRSPRNAFTAFVVAGNVARSGIDEGWGVAAASIDFRNVPASVTRSDQIDLVRSLFELLDLTTFGVWSIPDNSAAPSIVLPFKQSRSDATLSLTMQRDDQGNWRIVMPAAAAMAAARKSLLAIHGGAPPAADAFRRLQNPRDAMRAFLEGMADWWGEGRALALSTLDLSGIPPLLHDTQGALVAQYLRRSLHHIGLIGLQSIPNDGTNREPYIHFVHRAGRIVIAPSGTGADTRWRFTARTVADIQKLHTAVESLPPAVATPPGLIPNDPFFTMHNFVKTHVPFLAERIGLWEYWQLLAVLTSLAVSLLLAVGAASLVCRIIGFIPGSADRQPRYFFWALALPLLWAIMQYVTVWLGVPGQFREYGLPFFGTVAVICAGVAAWHLLRVVGDFLSVQALRTVKTTDDILVTFALAAARLGVVLVAALGVAHFMSIPTASILAGLGIGGLAFAFASRETLSNVFGAGILVTDRPFRRGDWIKTPEIEGSVEEVGIRSTRLRTVQDSVVVVPNGKLADSTIDNMGTRGPRSIKVQLLVTEGGTPENLLKLIAALRKRIEDDSAFDAARTDIGVSGITPGGIEVELTSALNASTKSAENAARHKLLIDTLRLAEESGLSLGPATKPAATGG